MTADALRKEVAREVSHGRQSLAAGRALYQLNLLNDALGRAYYAAFHLAAALLLTEGIEPKPHRALPGLIVSHLGGAGFDSGDAARLARLATYRDRADYERAFDANAELVEDALRDAECFMEKALACLRARGALADETTGSV